MLSYICAVYGQTFYVCGPDFPDAAQDYFMRLDTLIL